MMVVQIRLFIEGEDLIPDIILNNLSEELIIKDSYQKGDWYQIAHQKTQYHEGGVIFTHPKEICIDRDGFAKYEDLFIQFLKQNIAKIREYGGTDITFLYNVYYSSQDMHYVSYSNEMLKVVAECEANISIDFFRFTEEEIKNCWNLR